MIQLADTRNLRDPETNPDYVSSWIKKINLIKSNKFVQPNSNSYWLSIKNKKQFILCFLSKSSFESLIAFIFRYFLKVCLSWKNIKLIFFNIFFYNFDVLIIKIKNNFNIFLKNTFKIIIFLMFAHKQV